MQEPTTKNNPRLRLAAGWLSASLLVLLGALVVVWGTEYKLSLYKAQPTMQMPAKLCTRSSEAAKSQVHLAIRPSQIKTPLMDAIEIDLDPASNNAVVISPTDPIDSSLPSTPQKTPHVAFRPPPASPRVAA